MFVRARTSLGSSIAAHRRLDLFLTSLKLGCTSFGGPIAHLGYFRNEYVLNRGWIDDSTYADLVALCQLLPGPASSQVGIGIGTMRAGRIGGVLAWLGFTLPSAIALTTFAWLVKSIDISNAGWVHGLTIAAVAVVAQAVWGMAHRFCIDRIRIVMAIAAAALLIARPTAIAQFVVILAGGIIGWRVLSPLLAIAPVRHERSPISRRFGLAMLALFFLLLFGLPLAARSDRSGPFEMSNIFYQAGALVFGGGHVVLPILQRQVVPAGWMSDETFLGGYGVTQAMPGPLFAFSAFLGAVRDPTPNGVGGATLALVAMFLPSFLLIWGGLPFWDTLRTASVFRGALAGINAVVVGLLGAALYSPVITTAIVRPLDGVLAALCLWLLTARRWAPLPVVAIAAIGGEVLARVT